MTVRAQGSCMLLQSLGRGFGGGQQQRQAARDLLAGKPVLSI
jgi:hypothetical protein